MSDATDPTPRPTPFASKGKIPGAMIAASMTAAAAAEEDVVDVDLQNVSVGDLSIETVTVAGGGEDIGALAYDVSDGASHDAGDTGSLLPLKPMIGGAAAAAVVLAALFALRQSDAVGPTQATADVLPPTAQVADDGASIIDAEGVADTPADAPVEARVAFGTFATQADAEAICFELWTHRIDAEVRQDGSGWRRRARGEDQPEREPDR